MNAKNNLDYFDNQEQIFSLLILPILATPLVYNLKLSTPNLTK